MSHRPESQETVHKSISTITPQYDVETETEDEDLELAVDLGVVDLNQGPSLIEEEIDEVLGNDTNSAQDVFLDLLARMDPNHAIEVRFDQVMHGDLDFSVLKSQGFNKIKTIIFEKPGQATHLRNLPEGLERVEVRHQLITTLDKLPSTLEELDLTENALTKFDGSDLPKLRVLRLSNNELMEIMNLPSTLEILECENNQLRRIDLANTPDLKTLHCSNNPLLIVEHPPATLDDFDMENSPLMEMDTSRDNQYGGEEDKSVDRRINYLESIQEYFRIKSAYDEKTKKMKRAAFEKAKSKRAGAKRAKEVKPTCIYCKRPVGTIFSTANAKYTAICGDKSKPCPLNIQIFNGDNFNMIQLLSIYQEDVIEAKDTIIRQKLDAIFHYLDDAKSVKQFKDTLDKYNETSKMYTDLMARYEELYENQEKRAQITRKQQEVYRVQEQMSVLYQEYKKTGEKEILNTMVRTYKDDLLPILQQIRLLKYDTVFVETTEDQQQKWTSTLIQNEVALHKRDFVYGESPRVIKYNMV